MYYITGELTISIFLPSKKETCCIFNFYPYNLYLLLPLLPHLLTFIYCIHTHSYMYIPPSPHPLTLHILTPSVPPPYTLPSTSSHPPPHPLTHSSPPLTPSPHLSMLQDTDEEEDVPGQGHPGEAGLSYTASQQPLTQRRAEQLRQRQLKLCVGHICKNKTSHNTSILQQSLHFSVVMSTNAHEAHPPGKLEAGHPQNLTLLEMEYTYFNER